MIPILLNGVWSLIGFGAALLSVPYKISLQHEPFAIIIWVKSFWWRRVKNVRASSAGSVVLCGPLILSNDIEHELVHIEQHYREPLLYPFLYFYESIKYGYRNNKYEIEAYERSSSVYKGKEILTRKL